VAYHHGDLKNALIEAGAEILSKEGVTGLSMRRVAQKVGVSQAAPYAHFVDKQALIAAIATDGYRRLYEQLQAAIARAGDDAARALMEGAWAYVEFALAHPSLFKVTMSNVVEKQKQYPAFVEISQKSFALVVTVAEALQEAGLLQPGPPVLAAVSLWSAIHGLVVLLLEDQLGHAVLERFSAREMLRVLLQQLCGVEGSSPRKKARRP
jgi:AcrR family transcriptional regulator